MREKIRFEHYDYAGYSAFIGYSMCSFAIPLTIVEMGKSLNFPLDAGGMAAGGLLHLSRSIAIVVALLGSGILAGRIGKRCSMGIAMLIIGTGIILCACSPWYSLLLPLLLIAGFGEGICEGIATPFVQDLHADAPEKYINIAHSMWSVGILICVGMTGLLLSFGVSWRIVLFLCGLFSLFSALTFFWKAHEGKIYPENPHKDNPADIWHYTKDICKSKRFWIYCTGMFLGAGAEFCLTFWAAAYLQLNFKASAWIAGVGTAAIAAGMCVGRMGFGYFAKKEHLKHLLVYSAAGTIPLILLLAFLKPGMFPSLNFMFAVLILLLFFCGIGIAPFWPTLQVYGVNQLPELDSTMLYIYFSAMGVPGCGFFTWIMGIAGDHFGLRGAFLLLPATLILYILLIVFEGWIFPKKIK